MKYWLILTFVFMTIICINAESSNCPVKSSGQITSLDNSVKKDVPIASKNKSVKTISDIKDAKLKFVIDGVVSYWVSSDMSAIPAANFTTTLSQVGNTGEIKVKVNMEVFYINGSDQLSSKSCEIDSDYKLLAHKYPSSTMCLKVTRGAKITYLACIGVLVSAVTWSDSAHRNGTAIMTIDIGDVTVATINGNKTTKTTISVNDSRSFIININE